MVDISRTIHVVGATTRVVPNGRLGRISWFFALIWVVGWGAAEATSEPDAEAKGRQLLDRVVESMADPARFDKLKAMRMWGQSFSKEEGTETIDVSILTPFPKKGRGL
ncbi:MAG: hypothetical protein MPN21_14895 [Thermoanaerobaculia bacterium]|nr:hypothetical protein [Thermoanaerobaculia bacterium]